MAMKIKSGTEHLAPFFREDQVAKMPPLKKKQGMEKELAKLFNEYIREDSALFDGYVDGVKIEWKKQSGTQWFDVGKLYDLSEEDQKIVMVFVSHSGKPEYKVTGVYGITIGDFMDLATQDEDLQEAGWNEEILETTAEWKIKYPKFISKVSIYMPKFIRENKEVFEVYFEE